MPIYRNRAVFEIVRGAKAFLNLEAGVTRGRVPDPGSSEAQRKLKQARQRIAEKDQKISELQAELARLRAAAPVKTQATAGPQKEGDSAGPGSELVPPEEMSHLGGADEGSQTMGRRWLATLTTGPGGLQPDGSVLDVGCGVGGKAIPLTGYLSEGGAYEGFDVSPEGIAWCQQNITPRYPNFRFRVADIYSKRYNPEGKHRADEYTFPYDDKSFDLVFLASVFTHLLPGAMENYLSEVSRVLKSGGRCLITYFLLNETSIKRIEEGGIHPKLPEFKHNYGQYRLWSERTPEAAVAHDESAVRELYERHGLEIVEPVHYGWWAGREGRFTGQDMILATKR